MMGSRAFDWPDGDKSPCTCPHCGHVDEVQVSEAGTYNLVFLEGECNACSGQYTIAPNKAGTLAAQKLPRDALSHLVKHHYDVGDQGVTVTAPVDLDVRRAAVYIQFSAEDWYGETAMVTNLGIAAALVAFYGCQHSPRNFRGAVIDMYFDREKACGNAQTLLADESLRREGLREFLRPHVIVC